MFYFIKNKLSFLQNSSQNGVNGVFRQWVSKIFRGGGEPSLREFDEERSATVRFLAGSAPGKPKHAIKTLKNRNAQVVANLLQACGLAVIKPTPGCVPTACSRA